MSEQKKTVETYMDGFRATDHAKILSCLTDDVIWEIPGFSHHEGIEAFDKEIENPNADGHPQITILQMIEEGNKVVAEGAVSARMKNSDMLNLTFCDIFEFRKGKICKLTSYLAFKK